MAVFASSSSAAAAVAECHCFTLFSFSTSSSVFSFCDPSSSSSGRRFLKSPSVCGQTSFSSSLRFRTQFGYSRNVQQINKDFSSSHQWQRRRRRRRGSGFSASASDPNSDEELDKTIQDLDSKQPQLWYFAVANAQSLMLQGALLESVLKDGIEKAERAQRPRDVWLVLEPSFLKNHPELQDLSACLEKPTAAILSTNGDWMLSYVKSRLPQALIGKFVSPSTAVPNALQSCLSSDDTLVGGGGVWH
ncbi:unnamed protein product [Sphagnum jensenii]|uniref:Uncharacterized protein n=1 Tax=Sphagnum jensenii TaxID=128206 RepID=A0ABP0VYT8_9BRYO